jgi:hypothetical protein
MCVIGLKEPGLDILAFIRTVCRSQGHSLASGILKDKMCGLCLKGLGLGLTMFALTTSLDNSIVN